MKTFRFRPIGLVILGLLFLGWGHQVIAQTPLKTKSFGPKVYKGTSVEVFLEDVANFLGTTIVWPLEKKVKSYEVNLSLAQAISPEELTQVVSSVLGKMGLELFKEENFYRIVQLRELRTLPVEVISVGELPGRQNFSSTTIRLTYPLASAFAKTIRPYLSRQGRIIDFGDERSLFVQDNSANIKRLLEIAKALDTETNYQELMKKRLAESKKQPSSEVVALQKALQKSEAQYDVLKEMYAELKGEFEYEAKK